MNKVSKRKGRKFGTPNPIKVGDKFTMKSGRVCEVIEYLGANKIHVVFEDGHSLWLRYGTLREGSFVHPLDRTVQKVGYIGFGQYSQSKDKVAYMKWTGVLERVYDNKFHKKKNGGRYAGTLLDKDWHNFQNFTKWFYEQEYQKGWQIDKDLLSGEVTIYSANTCVLVPRNINMATIRNKGYTKLSGYGRANKPFQVNISRYDVKITVGYAEDEATASLMYQQAKLDYLTCLINSADMSSRLKERLLEAVKVKYDC